MNSTMLTMLTMTDAPSSTTLRFPLALGLLGASLLVSSGCGRIVGQAVDEAFEDIRDSAEYEGPVALEVEAAPALDANLVKVGLVPQQSLQTVQTGDDEAEEQWIRLRVSTPNDGRVRLAAQWTQDEDGFFDEDRFGGVVHVQPLGVVVASDRLEFELPADAPIDEIYSLVAWYDADDNDRIQLSQDDTSEYVRVFRSENDDQEFMFTDLSYNANTEDPSDVWWSGNAVHEGNGGDERFDQNVDEDWVGSPWTARVQGDLEAPLE